MAGAIIAILTAFC